MPRLLLTATIIALSSAATQAAPVFRSVADEPTLQLPSSASRVEAPAAAPITSETPAAAQPLPPAEIARTHPKSRDGEEIDSEGSGAIPALSMESTTENGITYVSGGVSGEEVEQLQANAAQFNIQLGITGMHGEFVSDVNVKLLDEKGTILVSIDDAGPYVYFQVAVGTYTAEISSNGSTKTTKLTITDGNIVKQTVRI